MEILRRHSTSPTNTERLCCASYWPFMVERWCVEDVIWGGSYQVDLGIYKRNVRTGTSLQGFINLNIFRGKLKDRFDECTQTRNLNNPNKQTAEPSCLQTDGDIFLHCYLCSKSEEGFLKGYPEEGCHSGEDTKKKNKVVRPPARRHVPPRPGRHRFHSDMWPLPRPSSCVTPRLSPAGLPVDPLANNVKMPWR